MVSASRGLLVAGNEKLSQAIQHFDLPAGITCPGASDLCRSRCYARKGRFRFPQVQERLQYCHDMAKRSDFARLMIHEIRMKGSAFVVRIHVSGDYFSADYVSKWIRIIKASPNTRFFGYTRSHRSDSIRPALEELARQPRMRLWYSADSETGVPDVPKGVKVAWMQVSPDEEIPDGVDLVFRDYSLRRQKPLMLGNIIAELEALKTQAPDCRLTDAGHARNTAIDKCISIVRKHLTAQENDYAGGASTRKDEVHAGGGLPLDIEPSSGVKTTSPAPAQAKQDEIDGAKIIAHVLTGHRGGFWECSLCGPMRCEMSAPTTSDSSAS